MAAARSSWRLREVSVRGGTCVGPQAKEMVQNPAGSAAARSAKERAAV